MNEIPGWRDAGPFGFHGDGRDLPFYQYGRFWGATTASVDWCEDNYAIGAFAAEFWNTASSLVYRTTITLC